LYRIAFLLSNSAGIRLLQFDERYAQLVAAPGIRM
jgi:hypothetical protein